MNYMAIAVETFVNSNNQKDYKVWYLELTPQGKVLGIKSLKREELIHQLMMQYQQFGKSKWRAFLKGREESTPIELFDFVAMSTEDNTHFGALPTLSEFQEVLDRLKIQFDFKQMAS